MQKTCIDRFDSMDCRATVNFCDEQLSTAMWATGMSLMHSTVYLIPESEKKTTRSKCI